MRDWIKTTEQLPTIPDNKFGVVVLGAYWDKHYAQHLIESGKDPMAAWDVYDAHFMKKDGWVDTILRGDGAGWYETMADEPPLYWQYCPEPPALIPE